MVLRAALLVCSLSVAAAQLLAAGHHPRVVLPGEGDQILPRGAKYPPTFEGAKLDMHDQATKTMEGTFMPGNGPDSVPEIATALASLGINPANAVSGPAIPVIQRPVAFGPRRYPAERTLTPIPFDNSKSASHPRNQMARGVAQYNSRAAQMTIARAGVQRALGGGGMMMDDPVALRGAERGQGLLAHQVGHRAGGPVPTADNVAAEQEGSDWFDFHYGEHKGHAVNYRLVTSPMTWGGAEERCGGYNGALMSVHSEALLNHLSPMLSDHKCDQSGTWFGLTWPRASHDSHGWTWIDGSKMTYRRWCVLFMKCPFVCFCCFSWTEILFTSAAHVVSHTRRRLMSLCSSLAAGPRKWTTRHRRGVVPYSWSLRTAPQVA